MRGWEPSICGIPSRNTVWQRTHTLDWAIGLARLGQEDPLEFVISSGYISLARLCRPLWASERRRLQKTDILRPSAAQEILSEPI